MISTGGSIGPTELVADLARDMGRQDLVNGLAWGEIWTQIAGDEEIIRLDREIAHIEARGYEHSNFEHHLQSLADLHDARNARVKKLLSRTTPSFSLDGHRAC